MSARARDVAVVVRAASFGVDRATSFGVDRATGSGVGRRGVAHCVIPFIHACTLAASVIRLHLVLNVNSLCLSVSLCLSLCLRASSVCLSLTLSVFLCLSLAVCLFSHHRRALFPSH